MAKFKSTPSLQEMEEALGFAAASLTLPSSERFYCDLKSVHEKTLRQYLREYDELKANQTQRGLKETPLDSQRLLEGLEVIDSDDRQTVITRTDRTGRYKYFVDIRYHSGFCLPLLFSEAEASRAIAAARPSSTGTDQKNSLFLSLPRELREKVYYFALPTRELGIKDVDAFNRRCFPAAVGDPVGDFFQLGEEPTVLKINRQIRREALPLAYRNTTFSLDDLDGAVKFLVAIGQIGRSNLTALQFSWDSKNEFECRSAEDQQVNDGHPGLPATHAVRCVQLLKECRRLKWLQICMDRDMLEKQSREGFMADSGIAGLSTLKGIEKLELVDATQESLEGHPLMSEFPCWKHGSDAGQCATEDRKPPAE
ncbi:hypothetical protein ACJZ2D_016365 [Fusarium nematophilum]